MPTIVTYSEQKRSVNAYPRRIVSPSHSSACCRTDMIQIGELEKEDDRFYYYRRCLNCGFTVRHFFPCLAQRPPETVPEVSGLLKLVATASGHPSWTSDR